MAVSRLNRNFKTAVVNSELKKLALKVSERRLKKEDAWANVQTGFEFEI